jgi:hypothetical protein
MHARNEDAIMLGGGQIHRRGHRCWNPFRLRIDKNREEKVDGKHDEREEDGKSKPRPAQVSRPAEWTRKYVYIVRSCVYNRGSLHRIFASCLKAAVNSHENTEPVGSCTL